MVLRGAAGRGRVPPSPVTRRGAAGIMIHYFAMAAVIWWFCMALEVYLRLCTAIPAPRVERLRPWFHIAGWGIPVLFVVPVLIGRQYGYRAPTEWCVSAPSAQPPRSCRSRPDHAVPAGALFAASISPRARTSPFGNSVCSTVPSSFSCCPPSSLWAAPWCSWSKWVPPPRLPHAPR